jgi:adenosylcobinamide-phosphate synthase
MSYKAINTLDSMIGHPEPPYRYFGRVAARLDDAANIVPARLTALGIVTAARLHALYTTSAVLAPIGGVCFSLPSRCGQAKACPTSDEELAKQLSAQCIDGSNSYRIWRRDGDKHASPNAGQSEAAMAGALGVRLGGDSSYDGHPHSTPLLNADGRTPTLRDAKAAMSLVAIVSGLAFGAALLAVAWGRRR